MTVENNDDEETLKARHEVFHHNGVEDDGERWEVMYVDDCKFCREEWEAWDAENKAKCPHENISLGICTDCGKTKEDTYNG